MAQPQLDRDILKLLKDNKKIEALKRLRARTGVGLQEAKELIEAAQRLHGQLPGAPPTPPPPGLPQHTQQHQFQRTDEGVAEIRPAEEYRHRPGLGPGEVAPPKNPIVKMAAFLMLVAFAIWYFLQ